MRVDDVRKKDLTEKRVQKNFKKKNHGSTLFRIQNSWTSSREVLISLIEPETFRIGSLKPDWRLKETWWTNFPPELEETRTPRSVWYPLGIYLVGYPYKYARDWRVSSNTDGPLLSLADVPSRLPVSDFGFYPGQSASGILQNQH